MFDVHVAAVPGGWGVFREYNPDETNDYTFLLGMYQIPETAFAGMTEMKSVRDTGNLPLITEVIERFEQHGCVILWIHHDAIERKK